LYRLIPYVRVAFEVYYALIIVRVLLSWIPHDPYRSVFRFVYEITEPVLAPFRRLIGGRMAIDFSPIFALLALELLEKVVISILRYL